MTRMVSLIAVLVTLAAGPDEGWTQVEKKDGVTIESRKVTGSSFLELKYTSHTIKSVAAMCDEAWGDGSFDPTEPNLTARTVLQQSEGERLVYEQIAPALVSKRDYALKFSLERDERRCTVRYVIDNALAPPKRDGFVRMTKMWGTYTFVAGPSGTEVSWVTFADPGGAIPAFFASGPQKTECFERFKLMIVRAKP
jgi:hypothetical protein